MTPQFPVIEGEPHVEYVSPTNNGVQSLPAVLVEPIGGGGVYTVSRWLPTAEELQALLEGGSIYVWQLNHRAPLQPIALVTEPPQRFPETDHASDPA